MKKRILCMLLCIALLVGALPTAVFAENDTVTANGTEVSVSGTNSVGTLLAKSLDGDGNDTDAYNCLQDITVENGAATVLFSAFEDAELVVAIYDETTGRLTTSGKAAVHKDDTKATIMLETSEIPQYFTAEAFLLSADDYTPLCESFSTPMYTKAFQELLDSSCDDFDADRVLNLDESKNTNFAVYADDVKRSESDGTTNTVLAADDTALRYVINNPDSTVTSLQPGEFWSCEDGENVLIVKVASVTLQGNQAIITGQETSMEEVFDYAKIEGAADAGDAVIDASQMADGVTYNGMVDMEESPDTRAWNGEGSLNTGWSFSLYKEIEGDEASAKLNLSLNLSVTTKLKYYIAKSDSYISFTQEYKMSVKGELEDKLKLCEIPLTLVPIVIPVCGVINIEIEPNFVVEFSATVSVDTSLTWSAGLTYTQGTGFTNTSTKPTTEAEFSIEGKLFIGASVQIKFCIISSYICSISIGFEAGAEAKAKLTGRERDNGKLHYCDGCLDGTIHIVFRLKASADLFKFLKISKTVAEVKLLLGDFYNSFTYHEGGWGDCPHWYEEGTEPDPTDIVDSGTCGENLTWTLTSNGTLTISGIGEMDNYYILDGGEDWLCNAPWYSFRRMIKNVFITDGVTNIGDSAFYGADLTSVTIPNSVTGIGSYAFACGLARTSITIPNSVTSIGDYAFYMTDLTSVTIPSGVTSIGEGTFSCCGGLTSVTIPDSVTSIGFDAFFGCSNLTSIAIPNSVTQIGSGAFECCNKLINVTIPSSVTSIGINAFGGCDSLVSIQVDSNNVNYSSDDYGALFNKEKTDLVCFPGGYCGAYSVPEGVTSINDSAFESCDGLASVTIPSSVTSIGYHAFAHGGLDSIYFCGNAPTIGRVFDCNEVKVYYPAGNSTWTDEVRQDYGGYPTWIPWTPTKGAQVTATTDAHETRGLHTGEQNGNIVSFTGLIAGEQYVLIVSKNKSSNLLERKNLLYIAQAPAGEDGTLQFTMVPRESYANAFIGLYGKGAPSPEQTPCDGGENCPSGKFVDVNLKAWYHPYVDYAVTHGLFGGTSANTFEPETAMTRAMLVTVLWRYEGKPKGYQNTFSDVNAKSGSWYIDAVAWASANGVVNGVGNGKFEPEGKITREQMATILFRYAQKKGIDTSKCGNLGGFPDANQVSSYAKDAVQWAVGEGIINGSDGKLLPQGNATRAQVAAILMRFIENIVSK